MRVVVAGGHGLVGLRLLRLAAAAAHDAVGLVRNPGQVGELDDAGARALVVDLEHAGVDEVTGAVAGADAVVFAAGAGAGSGAARKVSMDRDGAVLLADAAVAGRVPRLLLVSSMNALAPDDEGYHDRVDEGDVFGTYLRAKGAAEAAVRDRDLDWVVLRPGRLTDKPGTGRVRLDRSVERGDVPRDDVAAVLLALLESSVGKVTLELVSGETDVTTAVGAMQGGSTRPTDGAGTSAG